MELLISREGNEVKLTWSDTRYTLQATTDFNQWVDLPGVASPATLSAKRKEKGSVPHNRTFCD